MKSENGMCWCCCGCSGCCSVLMLMVCCCSIQWNGNGNGKLEMKQAMHSFIHSFQKEIELYIYLPNAQHSNHKIFDRWGNMSREQRISHSIGSRLSIDCCDARCVFFSVCVFVRMVKLARCMDDKQHNGRIDDGNENYDYDDEVDNKKARVDHFIYFRSV